MQNLFQVASSGVAWSR